MIAEKASVWLYHQCNSFSFFRIFLKLADKVDMDEFSDDSETWPDRIINLRVTSPWLLKKPLFYIVISIASSVLIRYFRNLQIRWTWMKSQMSSKTGLIWSLFPELRPLIDEKSLFDFVISITCPVLIGIFETQIRGHRWNLWWLRRYLDRIINLRVTALWLLKKSLFDVVISITHSALIRSSWNWQIKWTWMESRISS